MEVRKEVFRSGKHVYLDHAGKPAVFDETPERIKHHCDSGNLMLKAGLPVPIPLEHDATASPLTPADQVRNNTGSVKSYMTEVDKKTGDHVLFAQLDVKDQSIADKLGKTINWVSPWFTSFVDGTGKAWNDVIGHVALTTRPRITKQQPFASISAAMSLLGTLPTPEVDARGVSLSRANRVVAKDGILLPAHPVAFSLAVGGVKFGIEDLKKKKQPDGDEDDDGGEEDDDDVSDMSADAGDEYPAGDDENPFDMELGGDEPGIPDVDHVEAACHLLELLGLPMPEGVGEENFIRSIYDAALEKLHSMKSKPKPEEKPAEAKPPMNPVIAEQQPAMMSLQEIKKISDPVLRQQCEATFSMNAKLERLQKAAFAEAAKRRLARIERLSKMNGKAKFRDSLLEQAKGASFSMTDDGTVQDSMENALGLLEMQAVNLPELLKSDVKSFSEMAQPQDQTTISDQRAEELANAAMKRMGIAVK